MLNIPRFWDFHTCIYDDSTLRDTNLCPCVSGGYSASDCLTLHDEVSTSLEKYGNQSPNDIVSSRKTWTMSNDSLCFGPRIEIRTSKIGIIRSWRTVIVVIIKDSIAATSDVTIFWVHIIWSNFRATNKHAENKAVHAWWLVKLSHAGGNMKFWSNFPGSCRHTFSSFTCSYIANRT